MILNDSQGHFPAPSSTTGLPPPPDRSAYTAAPADVLTAEAASWFMRRGYHISLPICPLAYDLAVDCGPGGIQRVQVKYTSTKRTHHNQYVAKICRSVYAADRTANAHGKTRRAPYTKEDIDYLFIGTPDSRYLIPVEAVAGRKNFINLGREWERYRLLDGEMGYRATMSTKLAHSTTSQVLSFPK